VGPAFSAAGVAVGVVVAAFNDPQHRLVLQRALAVLFLAGGHLLLARAQGLARINHPTLRRPRGALIQVEHVGTGGRSGHGIARGNGRGHVSNNGLATSSMGSKLEGRGVALLLAQVNNGFQCTHLGTSNLLISPAAERS
jgi:hypothetical protein